jgi:hypothetical protein
MIYLLKGIIQDAKSELEDRIDVLKGKPPKGHGEFSKRIQRRHSTFWNSPNSETVRNTPMKASDPIEIWRDVPNWQRKLSNKQNAREFAKKYGCRVPELYWKGRDVHKINFKNLPPQYVLKPTIGHSSKNVFLIESGFNLMDRVFYTSKELIEIMAKAIHQNPYVEFIIEEFVRNEAGHYVIPINYKFHTFNGVIAGINVINMTGPTDGFGRAYDEHWNLIADIGNDFQKCPYQNPPGCLDEMITHVKRLSEAYEIYVRIDFYATDKGAVFGEFSPTPSLGKYFTKKADKQFIKYWDKYCKGSI